MATGKRGTEEARPESAGEPVPTAGTAVAERPAAPVAEVGRTDEIGGGVMGMALFGGAEDMRLQIYTSLPKSRGHELITLLQGQADSIGNKIGETVAVEHVLVHRVEMVNDETGEIMEGDRVVLIGANGEAHAGVSIGIRRSLQLIMALHGLPPWSPPLNLKIGQINTRRGRRTYTLTPVK